MIYIGIDPGASGGLAALWKEGACKVTPMPATEKDVCDWIDSVCYGPPVFAVIEKVGGYVSGEGFKAGSSAMFNFGMNYGALRMALTAFTVPFEEVTPQKWQKSLGIAPRKKGTRRYINHEQDPKLPIGGGRYEEKGGESKTQFKNRLKAKAQQLFPDVKVTLVVADALLLADYCRRMKEGKS